MTDISRILNGSHPTLLEFYATWCPHCQKMMPIVDDLKELYEGRANIIQIEGEAHENLMDEYKVKSFPTWILYKDGQEVWRDSGEKPALELEDMIDRFV